MVIYHLIVRYHVYSLTSPPSQCLWVLSVSALDCSFSFVFFNIQPTNLQTRKRFRPNSFPHNPLSDPHPLNPVVSILYKNSGGRGPGFSLSSRAKRGTCSFLTSLYKNGGGKRPGFSLSSRAKRGICFFLTSLVRCFFASLLQFSERFNHVSQTQHFS